MSGGVTSIFKKREAKKVQKEQEKQAHDAKQPQSINFTGILYDQLKALEPAARQHVDFYVQQSDYGKAIVNWNMLLQIGQISDKLNYLLAELKKIQKKDEKGIAKE